MDDLEHLHLASRNVAALNTRIAQQPRIALSIDDNIWSTSLDLSVQQQCLAIESGPSLQTFSDAGCSGTRPSHIVQHTPSTEMPMDLISPTFAFNVEPGQSSLGTIMPQIQTVLPNIPKLNTSSVQPYPKKREPKAAIMTDQRWKPATDRIRHLWLIEKRTISKIREIVNKDFGFNATVRQYKDKIKKIGLQRNCITDDRKKILRHVRYRKDKLGKDSKGVRLRGHIIKEATIARWWKEQVLVRSLVVSRSPSPLPSEISIQTACHFNSLVSAHGAFYNESSSEIHSSITSRLLNAAQQSGQVITARHAQSIFNDIQQLLKTRCKPMKKIKRYKPMEITERYKWHPDLEQNLVQIRNQMNLQSKLMVGSEFISLPHDSTVSSYQRKSSRLKYRNMKFATWNTQHGRVELSFWTANTELTSENAVENTNQSVPSSCAKIALYTKSVTEAPVRINIEFDQANSIPIKLTYQRMIPNDSEIWKIVEVGSVEKLKEALVMRKASLTDRDENGRSLLSYAASADMPRISMCKFLLEHGADPNAIEFDSDGYAGPIFGHLFDLDSHDIDYVLREKTQYWKTMLEFDADLSLDTDNGEFWFSTYSYIHASASCATLEYVLHFGKPFINLDTEVWNSLCSHETHPLLSLAGHCRYRTICSFQLIEKAMLLLRLGANITCLDEEGNNILHYILRAESKDWWMTESQAEILMKDICDCNRCNIGFREPIQFLKVAISKGANIYAINKYGMTPTMTAKDYYREGEWAGALEECGIDVTEIRLHTEAWKTVLEEFEDECLNCFSEETAKRFEDFNSSFWISGYVYQKSSLSFEEFCKQQDARSKQQADCGYENSSRNYTYFRRTYGVVQDGNDSDSDSEWSEEQNEDSSEVFSDNVEGAVLHDDDEFELQEIAQTSTHDKSLDEVTPSQTHNEKSPFFDDSALPAGKADEDNLIGIDIDMVNAHHEFSTYDTHCFPFGSFDEPPQVQDSLNGLTQSLNHDGTFSFFDDSAPLVVRDAEVNLENIDILDLFFDFSTWDSDELPQSRES